MPIVVNMEKAKEIAKDTVRANRKQLLEQLDVEMMRALESGDTAKQTEIATKKQALRDATDNPLLTAAETPEDLKAAIPTVLVV